MRHKKMFRCIALTSFSLAVVGARQVEKSDFLAIRTVLVSVTGESSGPVLGLGTDDFEILERGEKRDIVEVGPSEKQTEILLLVDTSVAFWNETQHLRLALESFVRAVAPHNTMSIYEFGGRTVRLVEPTDDSAILTRAVKRVFPRRNEAAYVLDAIVETSRELGESERKEGDPAQVVIVTGNGPELSHNHYERAKEAGERLGVVYHVILYDAARGSGDFIHRAEVEEALTYLADETGGTFNRILTTLAIEKELGRIAEELQPRYRISYLTEVSPETQLEELSVSLPHRNARAELIRLLPEQKRVPISK